jgi:hypothetical protein
MQNETVPKAGWCRRRSACWTFMTRCTSDAQAKVAFEEMAENWLMGTSNNDDF